MRAAEKHTDRVRRRRRHYLRHREQVAAWKAAHRERVRAQGREWYRRHREARLEYDRARRPAANAHRKASDLRHPERYRARYQVHNAIRAGRLPKAEAQPCVDCGARASEYDQPCHNERIVRRGERRRVA
jgi:hypothetical protein